MSIRRLPIRYLLIVFAAASAGLLYGYDIGIIGPAMLFLTPQWHLSSWQTGLLIGSVFAGGTLATLCAGVLADWRGRRAVLRYAAVLFSVGLVCMLLSHSYFPLLAGRIIEGMGIGMATIVAPIYLTEIIPSQWRGRAVACFQLCITTAILLANGTSLLLDSYAHWQWLLATTAIPCLIMGIGAWRIPISPLWQQQRAEKNQARQRVRQLKHHEIVACLFVIAIACLQQLTGMNALLQFDPIILSKGGLANHLSALLSTTGVAAVNCLITLIAIAIIDRIGRRRLLMIGTLGLCLACLFLATVWFILPASLQRGYLLLAGLFAFVASFAIGPGAVMWVIMPELLPQRVRSIGLALAVSLSSLTVFIANSSFLSLANHFGFADIFLLFAVVSAIYCGLCYQFIPETKGQSLSDIEQHWSKRYQST